MGRISMRMEDEYLPAHSCEPILERHTHLYQANALPFLCLFPAAFAFLLCREPVWDGLPSAVDNVAACLGSDIGCRIEWSTVSAWLASFAAAAAGRAPIANSSLSIRHPHWSPSRRD